MAGGMNQLVKEGTVVFLFLIELLLVRHAHAILLRGIAGLSHAMLNFGTPGHLLDKLRRFGGEQRIRLHWDGRIAQAVALSDVEDMVEPKERHIPFFARFLIENLLLPPEEDRTRLLPVAHRSAKLIGLLEREPEGGFVGESREEKDVHSPIRLFRHEIPGPPGGHFPGLPPRNGALLEEGDNAIGDTAIYLVIHTWVLSLWVCE